jgi:hypothetical protein
MRALTLYCDRLGGKLVESLNSTAPAVIPDLARNDTVSLTLIHVEKSRAFPPLEHRLKLDPNEDSAAPWRFEQAKPRR